MRHWALTYIGKDTFQAETIIAEEGGSTKIEH